MTIGAQGCEVGRIVDNTQQSVFWKIFDGLDMTNFKMFVITTLTTTIPSKMSSDILCFVSDPSIGVGPTFITIGGFLYGHVWMSVVMAFAATNLFSF